MLSKKEIFAQDKITLFYNIFIFYFNLNKLLMRKLFYYFTEPF